MIIRPSTLCLFNTLHINDMDENYLLVSCLIPNLLKVTTISDMIALHIINLNERREMCADNADICTFKLRNEKNKIKQNKKNCLQASPESTLHKIS